jgi:hypothetical protein
MPGKINTPEQIITKLREAEAMLSQEATVAAISGMPLIMRYRSNINGKAD